MNLAVKIGKLRLKNPVMNASGTFGPEYGEFLNINSLGAYVAKTITLKARAGNPPPRVTETPSGMLNSIGLENKGAGDFVGEKLPELVRRVRIPIIVSIAGDDESEFKELAKILDKARGVDALEINMSCPNVKRGQGIGYRVQGADMIAQDEDAVYKVVKAVKKTTNLTVIAKLSPNVTDITTMAGAAEDAGADAVSLINTFPAMAVDIGSKRAVLGNITGGLSGPAIKPIALKMVRDTYRKIKIPIIGIGGIMDCRDALEFILCGASAVQIGTANFVNPAACLDAVKGIKRYLMLNRIKNINDIIGAIDE